MTTDWRAAYKQARSAWPDVTVDAERFREAYERAAAEASVHGDDLYWALACVAQQRVPLSKLTAKVRELLSRQGLAREAVDEVTQYALEVLVMAGPRREPRLLRYAGHSPLGGWLAVVLRRLASEALRRRTAVKAVGDDEALITRLSKTGEVAEFAHLRREYGSVFKQAFRDAVRTLERDQRDLLRQHYLERSSLEALAQARQVHRATVARHLREARERLLDSVRKAFAERSGLAGETLDGVMDLLQSQLDASISAFLPTGAVAPLEGRSKS